MKGGTKWSDAEEFQEIYEFQFSKALLKSSSPPPGYKRFPYHIVLDVIFYLSKEARVVDGVIGQNHQMSHVIVVWLALIQ